MEFANKVVLITGSAQGLGRATALAFASSGADIVLNDINRFRLGEAVLEIEKFGGQCLPVVADTSDKAEVEKMFDLAMVKFGRLDVLVNNAGITRDALLYKMTEDQWRQVIDVDLTGPFFCLQAAAKIMAKAMGGVIINISSDSRFGNIGQANYSAAKAGLVGLTRTAAKELASKNIRVNAISPGPINTEMLQAAPPGVLEQLLSTVPLGRTGEAREVGDLILFLASDRSAYITGQVINLDGGLHMS
jgi:3-oxoacyl-[acyl-carrier protein] reductase